MLPESLLSWVQSLYLLLRANDEKALFLLLLVEEAGVPLPVPGDVVIMFAGYRASIGQMSIWEAALSVTLAVQMGSTILYMISRRLGHTLLFKYGRFIHLDQSKLTKIERWIQRHGPAMVYVGRLIPGLRTPTSIVSGIFEIPFHQFLFYATLSAITWSAFWLSLGYFFGRSLLPVVRQLHHQLTVAAAAAVLLGGALLLSWWLWRRRSSSPSQSREVTSLPARREPRS